MDDHQQPASAEAAAYHRDGVLADQLADIERTWALHGPLLAEATAAAHGWRAATIIHPAAGDDTRPRVQQLHAAIGRLRAGRPWLVRCTDDTTVVLACPPDAEGAMFALLALAHDLDPGWQLHPRLA